MSSVMRMRGGLGMAAWAVWCLINLASPVAAQQGAMATQSPAPPIIETLTKVQVLSLMRNEGYAVEINERDNIEWKIDGMRAFMFVFDNGSTLQFYAAFSDGNATLKKVNEWNKSKKFSRAYLDDDGDPCLELDLDMDGGVTVNRIKDFLATCRASFQWWYADVVK